MYPGFNYRPTNTIKGTLVTRCPRPMVNAQHPSLWILIETLVGSLIPIWEVRKPRAVLQASCCPSTVGEHVQKLPGYMWRMPLGLHKVSTSSQLDHLSQIHGSSGSCSRAGGGKSRMPWNRVRKIRGQKINLRLMDSALCWRIYQLLHLPCNSVGLG